MLGIFQQHLDTLGVTFRVSPLNLATSLFMHYRYLFYLDGSSAGASEMDSLLAFFVVAKSSISTISAFSPRRRRQQFIWPRHPIWTGQQLVCLERSYIVENDSFYELKEGPKIKQLYNVSAFSAIINFHLMLTLRYPFSPRPLI